MNIVCCRLVLKWVICVLSVQLTYVCSCDRDISSRLLRGINVVSSTYVTYAVIPTSTAGIVDTGTTRMFPSPILDAHWPDLTQISSPLEILSRTTSFPYTWMQSQKRRWIRTQVSSESILSTQPPNFMATDQVFAVDIAAQLIQTDRNIAWRGVTGKQYSVTANCWEATAERGWISSSEILCGQ